MDFWRTVEILNKRKWLILLCGIVAAALMWGATRLVGSKWVATVDFIAPEKMTATGTGTADNGAADNGASDDNASANANIYETILKSEEVTRPVLKKLDQTQVSASFLGNIEFTANGNRLYQLKVTDTSPGRATQLANGLANQFIIVNHGLHARQAQKGVHLLEGQLKDADTQLAAARRRYDAYRAEHQIVGNLSNQVDSTLNALQQARLRRDDAQVKLTEAQARLQQKQAQLMELPAPSPAEVIASSPLMAKQDELTKAETALADLRTKYTDEMPAVQEALQHRDRLAAQFKQEWAENKAALMRSHNTAQLALKQEIRALQQEVAGDQAQIASLDGEVAGARADIERYKGLDSRLGVLAGAVAEASDVRNGFSSRLNSARLAMDVIDRQSPLVIMNRVSDFNPPVNASKGRTLKLILLATLAAMVSACAVLIGLNSVDRRLRTVSQAEIALPKGILAAIPQPNSSVGYADLARITEMQPQSLHSEAYRFLGLHLLSRPRQEARSIMVLAAKAEQGSTTTLCNLGITLAQAGKRVMIVDANIRTSEVHTVFGTANDYGFTDLLKDPTEETLARAVHHSSVKGLNFITSGPPPQNPWELFRSDRLAEMSRLIHQEADYVLYDTPSSLMFTDAMNLAPIVDAALLCVRALEPLTGTEERLVEMLEQSNVAVLGSVLNDVPAAVLEGYNNYQNFYEPAFAAQGRAALKGSADGETVAAPVIHLSNGSHRN